MILHCKDLLLVALLVILWCPTAVLSALPAATLNSLISRHSDAPWAPFALNGIPFSDIDRSSSASSPPSPSPPSTPFKVAFIADLALRPDFDTAGRRLLRLVARENVDATLLTGDMDYLEVGQNQPDRIGQRRTYPTTSVNMYEQILGSSHPIFAVFGNHEEQSDVLFQPQPTYPDEPTYAAVWKSRMERLSLNDTCAGWIGGDSVCSFTRNSQMLLVSSNIAVADEPHRLTQRRAEHEQFISTVLKEYGPRARWRICQWHVPNALMNTGNVPRSPQDDPGLRIYNMCIKAGAIIATGHDHAYARTRSLRQPVRFVKDSEEIATHGAPYYYEATASRAELLVLYEGSSFSFVNGLGGLEIRSPAHGKERKTHWARLKTATPGRPAQLGDTAALLCTFGELPPSKVFRNFPRTRDELIKVYELPPKVADRIANFAEQSGWCELKTAEGQVEDRFTLLSVVSVTPKPESQPILVQPVEPVPESVVPSPAASVADEIIAPATKHAAQPSEFTAAHAEVEKEVTPRPDETIAGSVAKTVAEPLDNSDSDLDIKPIYIWLPCGLILIPLLHHLLKGPPKLNHVS